MDKSIARILKKLLDRLLSIGNKPTVEAKVTMVFLDKSPFADLRPDCVELSGLIGACAA